MHLTHSTPSRLGSRTSQAHAPGPVTGDSRWPRTSIRVREGHRETWSDPRSAVGNPTNTPPPSPAKSPRKPTVPLNVMRQNLAEQYLPLAKSMAAQMSKIWPQTGDEFESAATLALVEAAANFDPERGVKFPTFARIRIRGALCDLQRQLLPPASQKAEDPSTPNRRPYRESPSVGVDPQTYGLVDDDCVHGDLDSQDEIREILRTLPTRLADLCRAIYVEGKTQCELAEQLGVTRSRVSYLHSEALAKLGKTWTLDGLEGRQRVRAQSTPSRLASLALSPV